MRIISKEKHGAMEMSVGTMVTIVLLMVVLVLGIFFIQRIFRSGTNAIDQIDNSVKAELNKLFGQDETKKIVFYPSREIEMKKGSSGGFAFSLRNTERTNGAFTYTVSVQEVGSDCTMTTDEADSLIILGKTSDTPIQIPSGSKLDDGIFVKFNIPDSAPLCNIRYGIDVKKDGQTYISTVGVDLTIK